MRKSTLYLVDKRMYFATPYKGGPKPKLFGMWRAKHAAPGPCTVRKVKPQ